MTTTKYWMNFYINRSNRISMLFEDPHTVLIEALEQIDDCDGFTDVHETVWTYTHTIYMDGDKVEIINMTEKVREMNEEARLDRLHNHAVTNGLREMQS